jgi:putative Mg2+ transporter-C (MgtC) family protein
LGGGAIIKGRGSVRGLTTAASLWLVTGIGLGIGAGYVIPSVLTAIISLLILYNLRYLKDYFSRDMYTLLSLSFHDIQSPLENIKEILAKYHPDLKIQFINYRHEIEANRTSYRLRLHCKEHMPWGKITVKLLRLPGLQEIVWEEGDVP